MGGGGGDEKKRERERERERERRKFLREREREFITMWTQELCCGRVRLRTCVANVLLTAQRTLLWPG